MKKVLWMLAAVVMVVSFLNGSFAEEKGKKSLEAVEVQSIEATVIGINAKERMVTVKGTDGATVDIKADQSVRNFEQIKVGDKLKIDYVSTIVLSLAEPTAKPGKTKVSDVQVAEKGQKPSMRSLDVVEVIATIIEVNKAERSVKVQGPEGKVVTLDLKRRVKSIDKLKVGDKVRAQFTLATAVAITKP